MRLTDALQKTRFITRGSEEEEEKKKTLDFIVKNSHRRRNGAIKRNEAERRGEGERGFDF